MVGYTSIVHICIMLLCLVILSQQVTEDERVRGYLTGVNGYNERAEAISNRHTVAMWAFYTNITDYNREQMTELSVLESEFDKNESIKAAEFNVSALTDASLKRQINMILDVGISGYEDTEVLKRIKTLEAKLTDIYGSAKWCNTSSDCKPLKPDLEDIITSSRNYDELKDVWKGWRDASGAKMKDTYVEMVELLNKAIKAGGRYADMGEYYRSWYEQEDFEDDVRRLFDDLRPLYDQLHAYVRRKLRDYYGAEHFSDSGHIPAHLLGNMWAQEWGTIYDILEPYPGQGQQSLTKEMLNQNYNVTHMYRVAEEFYTSIGMGPMPESFWRLSMLEKPDDGREVVCHASAWDFFNGTDFRIKQCTIVTKEHLHTVHHEIGHVQYFLEYINQPFLFRDGANPGFHEAVADIVSLSFETPEHLLKIGLQENLPSGTEGDINFLFQMALDKVAFLPFGYLIDQWRWSVFRGETTKDNYNEAWWDLRCRFQGISPPVARSENDFDPGAKYHVASNQLYIRYFVSFVATFQWHKALCELIGQTEPLHRCDIYQSTTAGQRLKEMLQMGSSRPWGEAMEKMTRGTSGFTNKLDAKALIDYFKPLEEWLEKENNKTGENIGWTRQSCPDGSFITSSSKSSVPSPSAFFIVFLIVFNLLLRSQP